MPRRCDLVLPCRDEAAALPGVLARVPDDFHVIVVDNGSRDGTAEVAAAGGAQVVLESQPGYGAAVQTGLEAATAELVAFMDGDGSLDPSDVLPLLARVESGTVDLALGRRRPVHSGVWPWHARVGNKVVMAWLGRRTGVQLGDIAPVRVAGRERLLGLDVQDRRFGYPVELLVRAHRAGWVLWEHDVDYHPRAAGTKSKVSGSVRGTLQTMRDFARVLP